MKTYFSLTLLSLVLISFTSCNIREKIEQKANEAIAEKIASTALGTDIESSNLSNADKNKVELDLNINGESITTDNAGLKKGIVNVASGGKDSDEVIIAITLQNASGNGSQSLQIGMQSVKQNFKTPLSIDLANTKAENGVQGSFMIMSITEAGMDMSLAKTGTLKVSEFSDEKIVLELDAQGGKNSAETHDGKNLTPYTGTITIHYPIMTFMGVKKEEIF